MLESVAHLETAHGRKYLAQLCKHFAHKIEVTVSENHGECHFACGLGILDADDYGLRMTARAENGEDLAQTQSVIESHLARFAFREELQPLDWQWQNKAG